MINIKHTTKIKDIIIFVNAHIIIGNAPVAFALSIQFQIIGKFVLSFIPQHQSEHSSFFEVAHGSDEIFHLQQYFQSGTFQHCKARQPSIHA